MSNSLINASYVANRELSAVVCSMRECADIFLNVNSIKRVKEFQPELRNKKGSNRDISFGNHILQMFVRRNVIIISLI